MSFKRGQIDNDKGLRTLPAVIAIAVAACVVQGCGDEQKRYVPNAGDDGSTPTMSTTEVSTLISDSGYTRYHLEAPLWHIFDDCEEPYWSFPEGLHVEQYDLQMNPAANVTADSAVFFSRKRLWRLDGHVVMVNTEADSFLTQQVFWDQQRKQLYTDSFIHIVRSERILEGYGFVSNEQMTDYTVTRPTAILPAVRPGTPRKASMPDSTAGRGKPEAPAAAKKAGEDAGAGVRTSSNPRKLRVDPLKQVDIK
ncbi:MAG: LPS export ABC transporter periplasmic protein LptC [Muribaculaceae bacterium]|nr:LPS export ABC transporter periplasmic protein LptC [Muribaculaceae bacterium]